MWLKLVGNFDLDFNPYQRGDKCDIVLKYFEFGIVWENVLQ